MPIINKSFLITLLFCVLLSPHLFSQDVLRNHINIIYVDNQIISDIVSIKDGDALPVVYLNQPDFSDLIVSEKKRKFIDFILPAILIEKEKIKTVYHYVLDNFDNLYLNDKTKPLYDYCACDTAYELLLCFTEQPTSIIIAQAAIESGWGTSRFFLEGFNLFGIHTYNNDDQTLKAQNSSRVYVKKYSSISESISHYLRTLARVNAYSEFRKHRALSQDVKYIIRYLTNYSERRELYISDIESIIEHNQLYKYDNLLIDN